MLIFELDAPVAEFQMTTLDLLEDCGNGSYPSLAVRAFDASGLMVGEDVREGVQGTSGLDLDWSVSADEIVRVEVTGADVEGCGGYGIDDIVLDAPDCDGDGIFDGKDVCPCVLAPGGVDDDGRPLGDLDGDCDVDMDDFTIMQQNFTGPQ